MALRTFAEIARYRGVPIRAHWTVFLIIAVAALASYQNPLVAIVGCATYVGVLFLHEMGHLLMARRFGLRAFEIRLYPIHGLCIHEAASTARAAATIALGGVLAQICVALPVAFLAEVTARGTGEATQAFLAIAGTYNLFVALFNLIPIAPLDGAAAWRLPGILIRSGLRRRRAKRMANLRLPGLD